MIATEELKETKEPTNAEVMQKIIETQKMIQAMMCDLGSLLYLRADVQVMKEFIDLQKEVQSRTAGVVMAWKKKTPP